MQMAEFAPQVLGLIQQTKRNFKTTVSEMLKKINKRSNKVKMDSMKNDQAYLKKNQIETRNKRRRGSYLVERTSTSSLNNTQLIISN